MNWVNLENFIVKLNLAIKQNLMFTMNPSGIWYALFYMGFSWNRRLSGTKSVAIVIPSECSSTPVSVACLWSAFVNRGRAQSHSNTLDTPWCRLGIKQSSGTAFHERDEVALASSGILFRCCLSMNSCLYSLNPC